MKKLGLVSSFIIFASLNASAAATDLIGKWAAPCNVANRAGTEFTSTLNEFKSDGTVESGNVVYGDSQCAGPVIRTEITDAANYSATDTSVQIDASVRGRSFLYTADYKISGDVLTLAYTKIVIDGQNQPVQPSTVLKRIH